MANQNADQIAEWNGVLGLKWAELQADLDKMTGPFGEAALAAALPQPGERAIDVGCGCGDTSLKLAAAVGAKGAVLGVDISQPMLEVARRRAAGAPQLRFEQADASRALLPAGQDLLFSRFGVMFFDAPAGAFDHMRKALKAGGRLAFVCWRAPRENSWAMTPVSAGRAAIGYQAQPADPHAPGPFAFADPDRVKGILTDAGFRDVALRPFEAPVYMGSTPRSAAEGASRMGPLSRLVREVGVEHLPRILDGVEAALEPLKGPDGSVSLTGATWVVTARNP
ncbi:MAG TPA: class I SAM-dependent methyltransferase [Hyphomonadaceae bacterium]|nr:class I SAM-dependent methyltransferase [Hyphomonadaceae bacterium]